MDKSLYADLDKIIDSLTDDERKWLTEWVREQMKKEKEAQNNEQNR